MVTECGPYGNDLLTTLTAESSKKVEILGRETQRPRSRGPQVSAAKSEALDELLVLLGLCGLQVIEELTSLINELHQPATRGMVTLVCGEMLAESVDPLGEQRHLHFGGPGVGRTAAELREDSALLLTG